MAGNLKGDLIVVAVILIWVICGALAIGGDVAYYQVKYQYNRGSVRADFAAALLPAVLGPLDLFITAAHTGFMEHGFCWTEKGCAALRRDK